MTGKASHSEKRPVWVQIVSLVRQQERREAMAAQLRRMQVAASFFDAVDAQDPSCRERLERLPSSGPWGQFKYNDKACTLSHLDLLNGFLASDADYCLALEDDAELSADLQLWLDDMCWWPEGADVVKLERWPDDRLYLLMDRHARGHLDRRIHRLRSRHSGTAGYIVNRRGAERIVAEQRPSVPIDHLLFNPGVSPVARALTVYQIVPALVRQPEKRHGPVRGERRSAGRPIGREIRRGLSQLSQLPSQLAGIVSGRDRLARINWADTTIASSQAELAGGAMDMATTN